MTRYTVRIKANIFVVLTTRCYKLTNRTDGDGTQSEYNSKRKVSVYHRPHYGLGRINMPYNDTALRILVTFSEEIVFGFIEER